LSSKAPLPPFSTAAQKPKQSPTPQESPRSTKRIAESSPICIDLSNSQFPIEDIQTIEVHPVALNLSGNPLNSAQIPAFTGLRSLEMDSCGIKSLDGFPFLPNLRRLSIADNQIENLKGIPVLPKLEHFILSGNPIAISIPLAIAAVSSLNLSFFNRIPIAEDDIRSGFALSPLVGHSLRLGRDVQSEATADLELQKSRQFLTADLQVYLSSHELGKAAFLTPTVTSPEKGEIRCHFESKSIKWYWNYLGDQGTEWQQIKAPPKTPDVLPIDVQHRLHLIKCSFELEATTYSIYTDQPIGKGAGELSLPFPLQPAIVGKPIEGGIISLLPLPTPTRSAWVCGERVINRGSGAVLLDEKQVGSQVACLLQPFIRSHPLIGFSTVFSATEVVAPLYPTVGGITFPEILIESQPIKFAKQFFPDREGQSQIYVERAHSASAEWVGVAQLSPQALEYTPQAADVGHFLRVSYTPITLEGLEGSTTYAYSCSKVIPDMPKFSNPVIGGVPKINYELVALADYTGGHKGKCCYDWYFSKKPISAKQGVTSRLTKVAERTQYFVPDCELAEGFLAVRMIPVRDDDVVGEPVFCTLDSPLALEGKPRLLPIQDRPIVSTTIHFPEQVDIMLSKTKGFYGFEVLRTGDSYTARERHIGRIVRIVNDTVDMNIGEVIAATPEVVSVEISAPNWQAGSTASVSVFHKHVKPDLLHIDWVREGLNFQKVVAINVPEYRITHEDVSYHLRAIATPLAADRSLLRSCSSKQSPAIRDPQYAEPQFKGDLVEGNAISVASDDPIASTVWLHSSGRKQYVEVGNGVSYVLQNSDVGTFIRGIATTAPGKQIVATSRTFVVQCMPSVEISLPAEVIEGQTIVPKKVWHGGREGNSQQLWFREVDAGWEKVHEGPTYKTTSADIDAVIRFVYQPVRDDDVKGNEVTVDCGPVNAADPIVKNVRITQNQSGLIEVQGDYSGGTEGMSLFVWRTCKDDGTTENVGKSIERELTPTDTFIGKTMDVVYVPVRADGLAGAPVVSPNRIVVEALPSVLSAELMVKHGKLKVGNPMRCRAKLSAGSKAKYQWSRGDGTAWEHIPTATGPEYVLTEDDRGFKMLCSVVAVNAKGWPSARYSASTSTHVLPPEKRILLDQTNWIVVGGTPKVVSGVLLSTRLKLESLAKAKLTWQRQVDGSWVDVRTDDVYQTTCNDIGYRLRAVAANGMATEPTNPVELQQVVLSCARVAIKGRNCCFVGRSNPSAVRWTIQFHDSGITMTNRNKTQKSSKWPLVQAEAVEGTCDEMVLWLDPATKFTLQPVLLDQRLQDVLGGQNVRDFIVLVVNGTREFCVTDSVPEISLCRPHRRFE
jgi:hypothetical protein